MSAPRERLTVDEALAAVLAELGTFVAPLGAAPHTGGERLPQVGAPDRLPTERVPLADALGLALARDVRAGWDVPPWPNASMDGYAVRAADVTAATHDAPTRLRVAGEVLAGTRWAGTLGHGEAVRIATGAPVPAGADAVIRVEDTTIDSTAAHDTVLVRDARDARTDRAAAGATRRNVRPAGEDLRAGALAATAGTLVTPGVVGLLAAAGAASVDVARRPRVAIVASGDELVGLDDLARARSGEAIVNANAPALAALVRAAGGEPVDFGVAPDTPEGVRDRLAAAGDAGCDVVLSTGGVSVGPRDLVRPAVAALGGTLHFWRVRMRPGGPLAFGTLPACGRVRPWFGLPGNPVSTVVTFTLFVRPLLRILARDARPFRRLLRATLAEPLTTAAPLTHFLRATLDNAPDEHGESGTLLAQLTGSQGSGLLSSVARADALLVIPAGTPALPAGAPARVLPLGDGVLGGDPFACATPPAYDGPLVLGRESGRRVGGERA